MSDDANAGREVVRYHHVNVFSDRVLAGNGLAVLESRTPLDPTVMLEITRELRQFESIFLVKADARGADASIFTPEEELTFAGHPVLGAAAVLHWEYQPAAAAAQWTLRVAGRPLTVHTTRRDASDVIDADMDQGPATIQRTLSRDEALEFAGALGVPDSELHPDLPAQVVTTGLPYLLLPVTGAGLASSGVQVADLTERLNRLGADFAYVLDPETPEGRTWDNRGAVEDVATGSAAGPAGAYLLEHGLRSAPDPILVHQGRFVGRPSMIRVRRSDDGSMWVGGPVVRFSIGVLESI